MSCPLNNATSFDSGNGKILYGDYLMLDKILNAQRMLSVTAEDGSVAHDEHLFIVIHQTYELWFKEIIYNLDLVRSELSKYQQINSAEIIKRLNRIVMILKLLVDQVLILETMSPMDFNAFRNYLNPASGFQSLQFRILENKLGLRHDYRTIKFNRTYTNVFQQDENAMDKIEKSLHEPSLLQLVDKWLEQTPHLEVVWSHYKSAIEERLFDGDDADIKKKREQYETLFDVDIHEAMVKRGDRKLSYNALHAGILINLYKDEPLYATSHHILMLFVDLDSMLSKWRFNHMMMVNRMIGNMQIGTGGSSGYQYLRSTLSDRYRPFNDLTNLVTYLIPKQLLQPLPQLLDNETWKNYGVRKETFESFYAAKTTNLSNGDLLINELNQMQNGQTCGNGLAAVCECSGKYSSGKCNCSEWCNAAAAANVNVHSSSEEETKELESSYESNTSSSSGLSHF